MNGDEGEKVTQLLQAMRSGDSKAAEMLLPVMYKELHRLARAYMRRERPDHTLQPTALIHEAYLKLAHQDVDWQNRDHFLGVAANVMRRVLVDYARAHKAERRAGGFKRVDLNESLAISPARMEEVVILDEALERLEKEHPRQARVVELRYFGGLSVDQIAALLGVAPRSVKRDWALARIFLLRELRPELQDAVPTQLGEE